MTLSIDVVVPTYRRWELAERCLEHLARQTVQHAVYVCEDSGDGVPAELRARFLDVRFLELGENRGFSIACNTAIAAGDGDVVVMLNNDAFVRPDFLEHVVAPFEADPGVGSVAALTLQDDERKIDNFGLTVDPTLAGHAIARGRNREWALRASPVIVGPGGGANAYRRSALDQVGGYDERLVMYGSDLDLALRLAAAGWRVAAAPDAVAVHPRSSSMGHRSSKAREQAGFARAYMVRRYGLLRGRRSARVLATEAVVVLGELVFSRDAVGLRSRLRGWRAAAGLPRHPLPPAAVVDRSIGFLRSLALRWASR